MKDVEVPEHVKERTLNGGGAKSYGFPFDQLRAGKDGFVIPREFWTTEGGLDDAHIDRKKDGSKLAGPADLRDRVRRAFYAWQKKDEEKRKDLLLGLDDIMAEGKYAGMSVYLLSKNAKPVRSAKTKESGTKAA
jgi:hypothetical protein